MLFDSQTNPVSGTTMNSYIVMTLLDVSGKLVLYCCNESGKNVCCNHLSLQWSFSCVCVCLDATATSPTRLLRKLPEQKPAGVKASELRNGEILFDPHTSMPTPI